MKCRSDVVKYYLVTPMRFRYVTEAVRWLEQEHDFSSGPLTVSGSNGVVFDGAVLSDAARFWAASVLQFLAHSYLDSGGYITWAEVTRYYSKYFAVMAWTTLCGYRTFWLDEWSGTKRRGAT